MTLDHRDIELCRKLRDLAGKIDRLVTHELGEQHTIGLVIQPTSRDGSGEIAEFQYISNAPRNFMHNAFRRLVEKWDAGMPDSPPHQRN